MADLNERACLRCGTLFTVRRGKAYCSEVCRKRDENKRLRVDASRAADAVDPMRGDDVRKDASRPLRGDETALGEPLAELSAGCTRISAMLNPTIEAIRHELEGWKIEDDHTIRTIARRMRVAATAVREALNG